MGTPINTTPSTIPVNTFSAAGVGQLQSAQWDTWMSELTTFKVKNSFSVLKYKKPYGTGYTVAYTTSVGENVKGRYNGSDLEIILQDTSIIPPSNAVNYVAVLIPSNSISYFLTGRKSSININSFDANFVKY